MPHSTNKELLFAIMVGTAGISLLVLWYQKVRKPRAAMSLPKLFSLDHTFGSTTLQDKTCNGQGTPAVFQRRQLQILEKLNELITNMEELKEEIRFLKESIPNLEEYIQDELGGKITVHRISPQHRARKRRATAVQRSATSNSSEETESEGGCCEKDKNFQSTCFEDEVASDPQHHGVSSTAQPNRSLSPKPPHHSATCTISSPKRSRKPTPSSPSSSSYCSERSQRLFFRFQKSKSFLCWRQRRANFDSQEDTSTSDCKSCSDYFDAVRSRRCFSSYNRSATFFECQPTNQDIFNLNEIEMFSKSPNYIPSMSEPTSGIVEEESFAVLSQDEDKPSSTEIPKIRLCQTFFLVRSAA